MNGIEATGMTAAITYYAGIKSTTPSLSDVLKTRIDIDNTVLQNLDGDSLKNALFIIDNIREHKMKINWSSNNVWSVRNKRKHVCDLSLVNDTLVIGPVNDVLATRVKNMSYTRENINWLIDALRNPVAGTQEAYAMQ